MVLAAREETRMSLSEFAEEEEDFLPVREWAGVGC